MVSHHLAVAAALIMAFLASMISQGMAVFNAFLSFCEFFCRLTMRRFCVLRETQNRPLSHPVNSGLSDGGIRGMMGKEMREKDTRV